MRLLFSFQIFPFLERFCSLKGKKIALLIISLPSLSHQLLFRRWKKRPLPLTSSHSSHITCLLPSPSSSSLSFYQTSCSALLSKTQNLLIGPSLAVGHTSTLSVMYLAWSGTARRSAYLPKPFLCLDWDLGELGMNTEQLHHQKFSAANAQ